MVGISVFTIREEHAWFRPPRIEPERGAINLRVNDPSIVDGTIHHALQDGRISGRRARLSWCRQYGGFYGAIEISIQSRLERHNPIYCLKKSGL